jgi:hypothetical protein
MKKNMNIKTYIMAVAMLCLLVYSSYGIPNFVQAGYWLEAEDLKAGDYFLLSDGGHAMVEGVTAKNDVETQEVNAGKRPEKVSKYNVLGPTYNHKVADTHTYYVGGNGVWVHNAGKECGGGGNRERILQNIEANRAAVSKSAFYRHIAKETRLRLALATLDARRKADSLGLKGKERRDFIERETSFWHRNLRGVARRMRQSQHHRVMSYDPVGLNPQFINPAVNISIVLRKLNLLLSGVKFPPIKITTNGIGKLWVEDGHHRLTAQWMLNNAGIEVKHPVRAIVTLEPEHKAIDMLLPNPHASPWNEMLFVEDFNEVIELWKALGIDWQ